MKRKLFLLTAIILSFSLFFSACSPRLVGEAKAKEAGLAYINKIFDVNETEATVKYEEREGVTFVDGYGVHKGNEEPNRVYVITVRSNEIENGYYAEVNAVTGEAYCASKALELLKPMTAEQQARADDLYAQDKEWAKVLCNTAAKETPHEASRWFFAKFRPDKPILPLIDICSEDPVELGHEVISYYYVVVLDGSIYNLSFVWPTFELQSINRIN